MKNKKTKEQFINDAINIHGDKYDYSLVEYKGDKVKVKIICKKHDIFLKTPNKHLSCKQGCPKCTRMNKYDTTFFIEKSKEVHGDNYDYSLVVLKNMLTKVKIICKKCNNVLELIPSNHIHLKQGCVKCSKNMLNKDEFVEKSNIIHDNKYDYSLVRYINARIKVKIICKKCNNIFEQMPYCHIGKKQGCPICNKSKGENKIKLLLNDSNILYYQQYKFNDCKNVYRLKFDFYLPNYNTCIEFDGKQHFEKVKMFGGQDRFDYQQKLDKIKTNYCLNNNIKLIRIKYNEDVEKILKEKIPIK